ncbi:unnamed protein product [Brassicogethes aeneus]|uniref:Regulatory protein zeste n=1 Tax=Brassicogethes aeneus TaxID=1431903 RepID=A0A9P0BAH9_BRAAE|nr:unnamed protein product [Brassicogethes aeneus]
MDRRNPRAANFSLKEERILLALIKKYRHIIESKELNKDSNRTKCNAWQVITKEFNSFTDNMYSPRDVASLKNKYFNLKKRTKAMLRQDLRNSNGLGENSQRLSSADEIEEMIKVQYVWILARMEEDVSDLIDVRACMDSPEAIVKTGPCYSGVKGALCVNQLEGVVCTKTLCCATVGKAWGHPCEHCPSRLECETGFLKNQKTGECVDINECEAIPHLCLGGQCVNTIGSFTCDCLPGQARNPDTNRCDDRNECEDENVCRDGRCVNTDGAFFCLCNPGFIQSQDKKFCIGKDGKQ